jgi:hypothetical protein
LEPPVNRRYLFAKAASAVTGVVALVAVVGAGVKWG